MKGVWSTAAVLAALAAAPLAPSTAYAQATAAVAAPLPPEKVALGEEIVRLGYPEAGRDAMFGGMVDTLTAQINQANEAQLAGAPSEIRAFVLERQADMIVELKQIMARHIPTIMDGMANAYADAFTVGELTEIRDFVVTPAGQAFLQRSAGLMSNPHYLAVTQPYMDEVMSEAQDWQRQIVAELQERFGEPEAAQ